MKFVLQALAWVPLGLFYLSVQPVSSSQVQGNRDIVPRSTPDEQNAHTGKWDDNSAINPQLPFEGEKDDVDAFQESFNDGILCSGSNSTDHGPGSDDGLDSDDESDPDDEPISVNEVLAETEPTMETSNQPALEELISENRTPKVLGDICSSREFKPTIANWWTSGADEWLRTYTAENKDTQAFKDRGLVGSIAKEYLGCKEFYRVDDRGTFHPNTCSISCLDVVEKVTDISEAKKVFFVLASAAGLAEQIRIVYNAIGEVPTGVAQLIRSAPKGGWQDPSATDTSNILFDTIGSTLLAVSPWITTTKTVEDGRSALQTAKHLYDSAVQVSDQAANGADPFKWDKAFDHNHEMSLAEIDFAQKGYSDGTQPIPEGMAEGTWYNTAVLRTKSVLEDARAFFVALENGDLATASSESFQVFQTVFGLDPNQPRRKQMNDLANVESALQDAAGRVAKALTGALAGLFRGDTPSADGTTNLSKVLRHGNYLPSSSEASISGLQKTNVGEIIGGNVFLKLFNNSLRKQPIYISCTKDLQHRTNPRKDAVGQQVKTCNGDNTGPQNLKACIGDYVCYMYEWNERSMRHMSHNKAPAGHESWDEKPWNINVQDIIISSVNSHFQKGAVVPIDTIEGVDNLFSANTLLTLGDPRKGTQFNIPVCVSDHNWNTRLDGWNTFCDTDKNCPAKNLPCHCGAWGMNTQSVWKDIGLLESPKRDYYSATVCPRQIQRKISDPLERYVAYCKLNIRRTGCKSRVDGSSRIQGRDRYCDVITGTLESMPKDPRTQDLPRTHQLDPTIKFMFECHIQKGGRGCQMYKETFERVWEQWGGWKGDQESEECGELIDGPEDDIEEEEA